MSKPFGTPGSVGFQIDIYGSAFCATCNEVHHASTDSKSDFYKTLRGLGWKQIKGEWHCASCAKEKVK